MVYLLEDDSSIRELVCYTLNKTGTGAEGYATPTEFWDAMSKNNPNLILLDIMLPEESGLDVLSRLKLSKHTEKIPVIMLTAKGSEFDKVTALDHGADDYITKPFGIMELVARVKAVLRRTVQVTDDNINNEVYSIDGLIVNVAGHNVTCDGKEINLTYKEFELLCFLFSNRNIVLNRDKILREVWGYEFDGENRTVDVHVRTLRQKLGKYGNVVQTVRGVGYRIGG